MATRVLQPGDGPARGTARSVRDSRWFGYLTRVSGGVSLAVSALRAIVIPPFTWRRDFVEQCWNTVKLCAVPVWLSIFFFHFGAVGIVGGELFEVLGTDERIAYFPPVGVIRETGAFISAVVIAGVVGTAICADLGARKVRDELDAMSVLGVDVVRKLVAPRLLALIVMTPLVSISAWEFNTLATYVTGVFVYGVDPDTFFAAFAGSLHHYELLASFVKTALFGLIIGVVFCYGGLNASGGSEGVGRAVNQAVVVAIVAIFLVNYAYNSTLLGAVPELQSLR